MEARRAGICRRSGPHVRARELIATTKTSLGASHPATLSARVLESEISANDLAYRYARLLMTCRYGDTPIGLQMREGQTVQQSIKQMNDSLNQWMQSNSDAQRACVEWPLLWLELEKVAVQIQLVLLRYARLMGIPDGVDTVVDLNGTPASELHQRIRGLQERAAALRVDDVDVRARLMLIELLDLADRRDDEIAEANSLAALSRACGYQQIEAEAKAHVEGTSQFRGARREMLAAQHEASEDEIVRATPEERAQLAENMRAFLRLPAERTANILDDIECTAFEHEITRTFCRHLDIQQHLGHTQDGATLYARRPLRRCACAPRQLVTLLPSTEWRALAAEFQRNYCKGCTVRDPVEPERPQ
jgi:hypothetical protein